MRSIYPRNSCGGAWTCLRTGSRRTVDTSCIPTSKRDAKFQGERFARRELRRLCHTMANVVSRFAAARFRWPRPRRRTAAPQPRGARFAAEPPRRRERCVARCQSPRRYVQIDAFGLAANLRSIHPRRAFLQPARPSSGLPGSDDIDCRFRGRAVDVARVRRVRMD